MGLSEKLLAAALTGAVLGAIGCASTQSQPTTPEGATGEKHACKGEHASCKGDHTCNGHAAPTGDAAPPEPSAEGADKSSCKAAGSCHS
jgi:hypothetical protein